MTRRWFWAAAAVVLLVVAVWVWHSRSDEHGVRTTDPQRIAIVTAVYGGAATAAQIDAALRAVTVVEARPDAPGYERDCGSGEACVFGTSWTDDTTAPDSHNGCDTRDDVMRRQLVALTMDPATADCTPLTGTLVDPYTGELVDYASHHFDIEIDHVVPLAYAWDMGASGWSQQLREQFANDDSMELLASWGPANQAKSDAGIAEWLPPDETFRCDYVLRFLQVAGHYGLAITTADARAAQETGRLCPS